MSRYIEADNAIERLGVYLMTDAQIEYGGLASKDIDDWKPIAIDILNGTPSIDIVRRKPVVGYEGYYEVDMYGNVYSVGRTVRVNDNGREYDKPVKEKKLTASKHSQGYRTISLTRNGKTEHKYVHRIVAEAYIPNPQGLPFINHKDEDKTNNFVGNLEWCTEQYNATYGNARTKQAEALRGRKHSEEHKDKIRQGNLGKHGKQRKVICLDDGKVFDSYNEAGKYYGISDKTVKACCERKSQGKRKTFRYADGEREGE